MIRFKAVTYVWNAFFHSEQKAELRFNIAVSRIELKHKGIKANKFLRLQRWIKGHYSLYKCSPYHSLYLRRCKIFYIHMRNDADTIISSINFRLLCKIVSVRKKEWMLQKKRVKITNTAKPLILVCVQLSKSTQNFEKTQTN